MGALIAALAALALQDAPPGDEALEAARRMDPGLERARAVAAVVAEAATQAEPVRLQARLVAGFEVWMEDYDAFRIEAATHLAEALHATSQARWSAFCLEGSLRRAGHYTRADEVLAGYQAVAPPEELVSVLERRAIVAAGAGWRERELRWLGAGLARGGDDATQMLGRLALAAGERGRARTLFRRLVEGHSGSPEALAEGPPWALRGWGLALLPTAPEPLPARAGGSGGPPACNPPTPDD